jgi:hypothetical protein
MDVARCVIVGGYRERDQVLRKKRKQGSCRFERENTRCVNYECLHESPTWGAAINLLANSEQPRGADSKRNTRCDDYKSLFIG